MNSNPHRLCPADSYIYLAGPYWSEDEDIRNSRAKTIGTAAGYLLFHKNPVYSPISMGIAIQKAFPEHNQSVFDRVQTWETQEDMMIKNCAMVIVLMLPGWKESKGVRREIEAAVKYDRPIKYFTIDDIYSLGDVYEKV